MRRIAIAVAFVAAVSLGFVPPAVAQYGGAAPGISDVSGALGANNTATGPSSSCVSGEAVVIYIDDVEVARAVADAEGGFQIPFINPTEPGTYVIRVDCRPPPDANSGE